MNRSLITQKEACPSVQNRQRSDATDRSLTLTSLYLLTFLAVGTGRCIISYGGKPKKQEKARVLWTGKALLIFRLVGPPAELAPFEKKTSVEGCGGGLQAAVFFPSSLWLEKRRPGGHRHGFWTIVWRIPYPILNQWVTSFSYPNLKMKFQLSQRLDNHGLEGRATVGAVRK